MLMHAVVAVGSDHYDMVKLNAKSDINKGMIYLSNETNKLRYNYTFLMHYNIYNNVASVLHSLISEYALFYYTDSTLTRRASKFPSQG